MVVNQVLKEEENDGIKYEINQCANWENKSCY